MGLSASHPETQVPESPHQTHDLRTESELDAARPAQQEATTTRTTTAQHGLKDILTGPTTTTDPAPEAAPLHGPSTTSSSPPPPHDPNPQHRLQDPATAACTTASQGEPLPSDPTAAVTRPPAPPSDNPSSAPAAATADTPASTHASALLPSASSFNRAIDEAVVQPIASGWVQAQAAAEEAALPGELLLLPGNKDSVPHYQEAAVPNSTKSSDPIQLQERLLQAAVAANQQQQQQQSQQQTRQQPPEQSQQQPQPAHLSKEEQPVDSATGQAGAAATGQLPLEVNSATAEPTAAIGISSSSTQAGAAAAANTAAASSAAAAGLAATAEAAPAPGAAPAAPDMKGPGSALGAVDGLGTTAPTVVGAGAAAGAGAGSAAAHAGNEADWVLVQGAPGAASAPGQQPLQHQAGSRSEAAQDLMRAVDSYKAPEEGLQVPTRGTVVIAGRPLAAGEVPEQPVIRLEDYDEK